MTPHEIITKKAEADLRLTDSQRKILKTLLSLASLEKPNGLQCSSSLRVIGTFVELTREMVRRNLNKLEELNYIRITHRNQNWGYPIANVYDIILPEVITFEKTNKDISFTLDDISTMQQTEYAINLNSISRYSMEAFVDFVYGKPKPAIIHLTIDVDLVVSIYKGRIFKIVYAHPKKHIEKLFIDTHIFDNSTDLKKFWGHPSVRFNIVPPRLTSKQFSRLNLNQLFEFKEYYFAFYIKFKEYQTISDELTEQLEKRLRLLKTIQYYFLNLYIDLHDLELQDKVDHHNQYRIRQEILKVMNSFRKNIKLELKLES